MEPSNSNRSIHLGSGCVLRHGPAFPHPQANRGFSFANGSTAQPLVQAPFGLTEVRLRHAPAIDQKKLAKAKRQGFRWFICTVLVRIPEPSHTVRNHTAVSCHLFSRVCPFSRLFYLLLFSLPKIIVRYRTGIIPFLSIESIFRRAHNVCC